MLKSLKFILLLFALPLVAMPINPATLSSGVIHKDATNFFYRVALTNGSLSQVALGGFRTEREVKAALNKFIRSMDGGTYYTNLARLSLLLGDANAARTPLVYKRGTNQFDTLNGGADTISKTPLGIVNNDANFFTTGLNDSDASDFQSIKAADGIGLGWWEGDTTPADGKTPLGSFNYDNGGGWHAPQFNAQLWLAKVTGPGFDGFGITVAPGHNNLSRTYGGSGGITNHHGNLRNSSASALANVTSTPIYMPYSDYKGTLGGYFVTDKPLTDVEDTDFNFKFTRVQMELGRVTQIGSKTVYFGDSITAGIGATSHIWQYSTLLSWRDGQLQNNWGLSGTRLQSGSTDNGVDRFTNAVILQFATNQANKVIMLYGLNDLRAYGQSGLIAFSNALDRVITVCVQSNILASQIWIGSPPLMWDYTSPSQAPTTNGSLVIQTNYALVAWQVASNRHTWYAPVFEAMAAIGTNLCVSSDGIHPTDFGHAVIFTNFLNAVQFP